MNRLKASIDLGTNTARLLIGAVDNGKIVRQHISRCITRLGGGFSKETGISAEAADRTVAAMKMFSDTLRKHHVNELRAVATSAVRDAVNGSLFCDQVRAETGIALQVIDGEEEGRLTLLGVISGLDSVPETVMVFDVGGGSTEYTIANGEKILFSKSLPLGVVRLAEGKGSLAKMDDKIIRELAVLKHEISSLGLLDRLHNATIVGTAGTATTLAAISIGLGDYDYEKVNNLNISLREIRGIFNRLLPLSPRERLTQIVGLEEGREDLIVAGALLTMRSLELFDFPSMKVSDFGLLEGILLDIRRPETS